MKNFELAKACRKGPLITNRCFHGNTKVQKVSCQDIVGCAECLNAWRSRVRARILNGVRKRGVDGWKFATLTFGSEEYKQMPDIIEECMERWTTYRKWLQRTSSRAGKEITFYRVVELTKAGVPHFHIVTNADLPIVGKIDKKNNEKLKEYLARQSPEGLRYIAMLKRMGFGEITDVQKVQRGSGIAKYLSSYLGKGTPKAIKRGDGRSIRIAEGARNWGTAGKTPNYFFERSKRDLEDTPECSVLCVCGRSDKQKIPLVLKEARRVASDTWDREVGRHRASSVQYLEGYKRAMAIRAQARKYRDRSRSNPIYRNPQLEKHREDGRRWNEQEVLSGMKMKALTKAVEEQGNYIPKQWLVKNKMGELLKCQ